MQEAVMLICSTLQPLCVCHWMVSPERYTTCILIQDNGLWYTTGRGNHVTD